jgi:hypothetical protein
VDFSPFKIPDAKNIRPEDLARMQKQAKHNNCAFKKVEIFPGNIGYVKFNGFMPPSVCGPTVGAGRVQLGSSIG